MAEEFADFIKELNKKSLEEQVIELKVITNKLINITENFIKYYDMELSIIHNKIIKIETEQLRRKLPKIKKLATPSSVAPNNRPIVNENVRGAIMSEIKKIFKQKKNDKNK